MANGKSTMAFCFCLHHCRNNRKKSHHSRRSVLSSIWCDCPGKVLAPLRKMRSYARVFPCHVRRVARCSHMVLCRILGGFRLGPHLRRDTAVLLTNWALKKLHRRMRGDYTYHNNIVSEFVNRLIHNII